MSEEIEPFCTMIIGRLWKRISTEIEHGKGDMKEYRLRTLGNSLWYAVKGLQSVISAIQNNGDYDDIGCTHASLALTNEIRSIKKILVNVWFDHMEGLIYNTKELDEAIDEEIKWRAILAKTKKT